MKRAMTGPLQNIVRAAKVVPCAPLFAYATGRASPKTGAAGMERRTSVPLQLVDVVKASIILMIAVRLAISIGLRRLLRVPPAAD